MPLPRGELILLLWLLCEAAPTLVSTPPCDGHCAGDPATVATDCAFKELALAAAAATQPHRDHAAR